MSKYKLIVMDMDDTLMNHENQVGEETKDYLIKIQDEGYKVVLASGRPTEGIKTKTDDLTQSLYKMSEKLYSQPGEAAGSENADDDVVDADYEVVDEEEDK